MTAASDTNIAAGDDGCLIFRSIKESGDSFRKIIRQSFDFVSSKRTSLEKLAASYKRNIAVIIPEISEKRSQRMGKKLKLVERYHDMMIPRMANRDRGFQIIDTCNNCGLCMEACPVGNIVITNGKPDFRHNCEQCMACIQLCPNKAIDYKGKCTKRNRYRHPDISVNEIIKFRKTGMYESEAFYSHL